MTATLLRSLRDRLLDESEPLAGLLRKCLLLGAETGSESLRQWARFELSGYDENVELPSYRMLRAPAIAVDSISGNTIATNQHFDRLQLPAAARKSVPEYVRLSQPIEELEKLAAQSALSITNTGLAYAQATWNKELEWPQQITAMRFTLSGSVIFGVLGQIRTHLVDVVADLTAETPLTDLPRKDQVDAAVGQHIGAQYFTTIHSAQGPTAIGTQAEATSDGLGVEDAIRLLDAVRAAAEAHSGQPDLTELIQAVEDLRAEAEDGSPDTGAVVKKAGRLRAAAETLGVPTLTSVVGGAVEAFTKLAMDGAFG